MDVKYVLDTDICIYIIKKKPQEVIDRFMSLTPGQIGISTITLAELHYGIAKSQFPEKNQVALDKMLKPIEILLFDDQAAFAYGGIRKQLEKLGTPIGPMDYLIAAQALSMGAVLVTNNEREYKRVKKLRVENWLHL